MDLIEGLPYDIARDCLTRLRYDDFVTIASVSKSWKAEIELPEFRLLRKVNGHGQKLSVMAQARVDPNHQFCVLKCLATPLYRLTVFELNSGNWSELPPVPGFSGGLPLFCQLVGVGSDLVVMGGWDPLTWNVSSCVFIYNFMSSTWRRGTNMPGCSRSFFGCASDSERMVYVAGGHDAEKNALRSVLSYDVVKDKWLPLPDMARERDECKALFLRGKLHVIGGYCSQMQGRFERSAEAFDIGRWQWSPVKEDFLKAATCPMTCVGEEGVIYTCHKGDVVEYSSDVWRVIAKIPTEVSNSMCTMTWQEKLVVIGSASVGEPYMIYILDLKNLTWVKIGTPQNFSGHVQSGCYMEI